MDLKKVLSEILNNSVTKFELCNVAHQLNCDIVSVQEFEVQKTRVKKEVLIHLLREASDDERQFYQDLLDETDFQLLLRRKKSVYVHRLQLHHISTSVLYHPPEEHAFSQDRLFVQFCEKV